MKIDPKAFLERTLTATILLAIITIGYHATSPIILIALCILLWALIAYDEWPRLQLPYRWFLIYPTVSILMLIALITVYRPLLLYLLLVICAHDTGAYFIGHWYGKHKLARTISPGKTWEGLIGGFASSYVCAAIGVSILSIPFTVPEFLLITGILNILGILGDLFESYLKRRVGLKDSGTFLPGHGGALDRLDSLLFAGPALLLYFIFIR